MSRHHFALIFLPCLYLSVGHSTAQGTVQRFTCSLDGERYLSSVDMRLQDPDGRWYCEQADGFESWSLPQHIESPRPRILISMCPPVRNESVPLEQPSGREEKSHLNAIIEQVARQVGLPSALLRSVVRAESGYRVRARSARGALGLMQLMPKTAGAYGAFTEEMLMDPQINLKVGATHLRDLLVRYHGRLDLALAAYNAGPDAVRRAGDAIPDFEETKRYVERIMLDLVRQ